MYSVYFERKGDAFTTDELVGLADAASLDADAAREEFADTVYLNQGVKDQVLAHTMGANGVPFFVIERAYGITGAQPLEVFLGATDQARATSTRWPAAASVVGPTTG